MRFEITGQWKDGYEQDALLYCAQRMEEMLMNYTSRTRKHPGFYLKCSDRCTGVFREYRKGMEKE